MEKGLVWARVGFSRTTEIRNWSGVSPKRLQMELIRQSPERATSTLVFEGSSTYGMLPRRRLRREPFGSLSPDFRRGTGGRRL